MDWDNTFGHEIIKQKLMDSIANNRISHAQLFAGKNGWGTLNLAIGYAAEIMASDKEETAKKRVLDLQHPDVHFSFPVTTTEKIKVPTSNHFFKEWREFALANPYGSLNDWLEFKDSGRKQGVINVHEIEEIVKFSSLRSYEGGHKVIIIWLPEKMNLSASNKILKSLEEPPQKTIFLLVTENEDALLPTIISRCQLVKLNRFSNPEIEKYLIDQKGLSQSEAQKITLASNGDLQLAIENLETSDDSFDAYFVQWVRNAFMARKSPAVLKDLVQWSSELSAWPREKQRQFLIYCSEIFRQALMQNYKADSLNYLDIKADGFKWEGFAPFIHGANIEAILNEINESAYHIERNANARIVLLDLSIKLTRFIHRKPV